MANTLGDLNNLLFEEMKRLTESKDSTELEMEIERSKAVSKIAENIIDNANLAYKTMKHKDEYSSKYGDHNSAEMLEVNE